MAIKTGKLVEIRLDYLACPITKKPLKHDDGALVAPDGYKYRFIDGLYWSFMPPIDFESDPKWKLWYHLQKNGEVAYKNDPAHNLGVGNRSDYIEFSRFCEYRGSVLDIGSGPQRMPTHFQHNADSDVVFFGIDLLVGEQPREYLFVHGLGEYLPFRDNLFDQTLFVTSLDHFIDPTAALLEAKRVIKSDGEICIWVGEKGENAPVSEENPKWYRELSKPDEAEDPFHLRRFSIEEFKEFVARAGLNIAKEEIYNVDEFRKNGFFKLIEA